MCIFLNRRPVSSSRCSASTFLLSCTPIVNLFTQIAEPIRVSHAQTEYQIIPDVRRQNVTEVYAVDRVTCTASHLPEPLDIAPFYPSGTRPRITPSLRCSGMRRVGLRKDQGMRGQRSISPW